MEEEVLKSKDYITRYDTKGNRETLIATKVIYIAVIDEVRKPDVSPDMFRAILKDNLNRKLTDEKILHSFVISVE